MAKWIPSSQPPKILVDEIKTEVTFYDSAPAPLEKKKGRQTDSRITRISACCRQRNSNCIPTGTAQPAPPAMHAPVDDFIPDPDDGLDGAPPPPEFPPDWENYTVPNRQYGFSAPATPDAAFFPAQPAEKTDEESQPAAKAPVSDDQNAASVGPDTVIAEPLPELVAAASSVPVAEPVEYPAPRVDLIPEAGLTLSAVIESLELERPTLPPILPLQSLSRP